MATTMKTTVHIASSGEDNPIGFFDLPREIRDVIYENSIISMRDDRWKGHSKTEYGDWTSLCHCQQDTLATIRPRPPYFAYHVKSCLVPDRFLLSISLVSKQFAAEIRPIFFQNTAFHLDTNTGNLKLSEPNFGGPLLTDYCEFINALGSEAKELRRLMIVVTKGKPSEDTDTYGVPDDSEEYPDPKVGDAERELEGLETLLHRSISILMVMRIYRDDMFIVRFFHCRGSDDAKRNFIAEEIDDPSEWEAYAESM